MKTALLQQDIVWGNPKENRKHIEDMLATAPAADLYVLPEMYSTGFATTPGATVETSEEEAVAWMLACARKADAAICGSIALRISGPDASGADRCANRFLFVTPEGDVHSYDKRHLFGYGGEGKRFNAGNERVVVEWRGVRFLLAVCYDLRFPVWLRNRDDYDAMILVASWPDVRRFAWDTLTRARAIEDQCYVLAVNRVGTDPACNYNGGTALIDPYGATVSSVADNQEGFATGEIDLSFLDAYRKKFPVLADADAFNLK